MSRACVIVLDAVGAGELPDAAEFGDEGSDTLGNVARAVGGLDLPNLEAFGLGNVEPLEGCPPQPGAPAVAGRLVERSKGKDTTTGHWELMGVVTDQPMPTYPHGFPFEVLDPFLHRAGRGVLGNQPDPAPDEVERGRDQPDRAAPARAGRGPRVHESRRDRHALGPPQRSGQLPPLPSGLRSPAPGPACSAPAGRPADSHLRPRLRPDHPI